MYFSLKNEKEEQDEEEEDGVWKPEIFLKPLVRILLGNHAFHMTTMLLKNYALLKE